MEYAERLRASRLAMQIRERRRISPGFKSMEGVILLSDYVEWLESQASDARPKKRSFLFWRW